MVVTGQPIPVEEAKEIIRRTDSFFGWLGGGNNRQYDDWVCDMLCVDLKHLWDAKEDWHEKHARQEFFFRRWRRIQTQYVHNSWLSSAFIGGPHGWCHPDGQIGYVDNVGKWPSIDDILKDWRKLARTFPFLDIGVTLYDREECEDGRHAVVSIAVSNGRAKLVDPLCVDVHAAHSPATRAGEVISATDAFVRSMRNGDERREQGIPDEWIYEWAQLAQDLRVLAPTC